MPRITTHYAVNAAFRYYLADYYDAGTPAQFRGQWLGAGAKMLGLHGQVKPQEFKRLLDNRHPQDGGKLSPRNHGQRRLGWDVNFNVPKSVSVVFAANGDFRVVDALRESVNETLLEMQQDVMTRVNSGPQQEHAKTGNLIAGVWIHPEARAVPGHLPDPNLHVHAFVSNHTHTGDRWTAADISNLYRDAQGYYEAAMQSRMATKLQALGYQVERSRHNFEIAGVSQSLIDQFSKRTAEINRLIDEENVAEKLAAKRGISLTDAKGMVGAVSRQGKVGSYSLDELQTHWRSQLSTDERRVLATLKQRRPLLRQPEITAEQAVDYALDNRFEHEAVVRERDMLRDGLLHGIGDNTVAAIKAELAKRDLIRQGTDEAAILTTENLQHEEREILSFAVTGRGAVKPLNADYQIKRDWLSDEQKQAVLSMLGSSDRLQILRGVAGVGKSTLLQELLPGITASGKRVAVMAPTNKAAANLNQEGFGATTIQSFLLNEQSRQQVKGGVIIVDESGLVGTPTFLRLIQVAEHQQARIIAVGDARQHLPIERGHPLKLLESQAGVQPKIVSAIRRQQGNYKEAVASFSRGEVEEGLKRLQELGFLHEISDQSRDATLAKAYADAKEKDRNQRLLAIAPTHAERRQITDAIRQELQARGLLSDDERSFTTLLPKQLTKAQRQDPLNYETGDVVAFFARGRGGIKPGEQLVVAKINDGKLFTDDQREIPLASAGAFSVFRPRTANYAVGDVIRLTRGRQQTGSQKKLVNGSRHAIKSIHKGVVTLDNGEKLRSDFRFWDHGVAVTSHVAQGTTVDRAFVAASSLSFAASSPEQMYVSASRARKRVDVFTDSAAGLLRAAGRLRPKRLATEIAADSATNSPLAPWRKSWNRVRHVAHRFATKQLQRFHGWLPDRTMQPQLAR